VRNDGFNKAADRKRKRRGHKTPSLCAADFADFGGQAKSSPVDDHAIEAAKKRPPDAG
jgi:hypothetical protein